MKRLGWFLAVAFAMALITTFISPINGSALIDDIGPPDAQLVSADIVALNGTTQITIADAKLIGPMAVTMPEVMDAGTWSGNAAQVGNELDESITGSSLDGRKHSGTITIAGGALATLTRTTATDMVVTFGPAARSSTVFDLTTDLRSPESRHRGRSMTKSARNGRDDSLQWDRSPDRRLSPALS